MLRYILAAAETARTAEERLAGERDLTYLIGFAIAVACVAGGIVLLRGTPEFLGRSRFLISRNGKMDAPAMAAARLTGVQMVAIGILLGLAVMFLFAGMALQGMGLAFICVLLPIPFSIYRKRSKRFQPEDYKPKKRG